MLSLKITMMMIWVPECLVQFLSLLFNFILYIIFKFATLNFDIYWFMIFETIFAQNVCACILRLNWWWIYLRKCPHFKIRIIFFKVTLFFQVWKILLIFNIMNSTFFVRIKWNITYIYLGTISAPINWW